MRLDHLLSKEEEVRVVLLLICQVQMTHKREVSKEDSGGDALRGHTRSHPEHDG